MPRFNAHVEALAPPAIPTVQAWARRYGGGRGDLIDLSQAVPGYPPHPDLLLLLAEEAAAPRNAGYGAIEGEPSLREAYAAMAARLYRAPIGARNIQVTSGCNQAFVASVLAVAGPGEAVLLVGPAYFNHEATLAMLGVRVETVRAEADEGFLPAPAAIEARLSPDVRALALVSPNNPTGATYPPGLLAELFGLCRRRGVWLILDETYRDFLPETDAPHGLFSQPGWADALIGLYSFSKSFCIPGHRLGAITAGPELVGQVTKIMDNLQICAPRAAQAALARAIPLLDDWREDNRRRIGPRAAALRSALARAEGWRIDAVGAYFAYVRHPFEGRDGVAVAEELAAERGVVAVPGGFFGAGQERHLRLAFANAAPETLARLGERLTPR